MSNDESLIIKCKERWSQKKIRDREMERYALPELPQQKKE
jgi:hypothetical protein